MFALFIRTDIIAFFRDIDLYFGTKKVCTTHKYSSVCIPVRLNLIVLSYPFYSPSLSPWPNFQGFGQYLIYYLITYSKKSLLKVMNMRCRGYFFASSSSCSLVKSLQSYNSKWYFSFSTENRVLLNLHYSVRSMELIQCWCKLRAHWCALTFSQSKML